MSLEFKYKSVYRGRDADHNRLPAHEGSSSLEGLSWSFYVVAHYAATGKIRSRGETSPHVKVFILPARQGSYTSDFLVYITQPENLALTSVLGTYAVSTFSQAFNALVVSSFRAVCGLASNLTQRENTWLSRLPSGDREALVAKIEPPMTRAHKVIGDGADMMQLKKGQSELLLLDYQTKIYLETNIKGEIREIMVRIGAYNANTGNGGAYLPELGRVVPFAVAKNRDVGTYAALTFSLDRYVNGRPSDILITAQEILTTDGRIKKLIISHAEKI